MQPTIVRTQLQRRTPLHFMADGLQVWASYLDTKNNEQFVVRFIWQEHQHACSPLHHITHDGGNTYHEFETFFMDDGAMDMSLTLQETDPKKLRTLHRIWAAYHTKLKEEEANERDSV